MSGPPRSHDGQVESARQVVQYPGGPLAAHTGVKGRLTTAVYNASITPTSRIRTALEAMLRAGPSEFTTALDGGADSDNRYAKPRCSGPLPGS